MIDSTSGNRAGSGGRQVLWHSYLAALLLVPQLWILGRYARQVQLAFAPVGLDGYYLSSPIVSAYLLCPPWLWWTFGGLLLALVIAKDLALPQRSVPYVNVALVVVLFLLGERLASAALVSLVEIMGGP